MKSLMDIALRAPVFRSMPEDDATPLLTKGRVRDVGRGASIHLQGERAHSMFIVIDGWVKLYRMSPCGSEAVVAVLTRGQCFGEVAAIRDEVYATGAEAVSEARLLQFDCQDLWKAVATNLSFCRALFSVMMKGNRDLVDQLEQLKSYTGTQRIADFLLGLCKDETGECTVLLPYDKVLIASWLGMKPESLSRSFRRLEPHGVKIIKNRATISSVERLMEFADEDPSYSWSQKTCLTN